MNGARAIGASMEGRYRPTTLRFAKTIDFAEPTHAP
jgi:hypothetical protein